MAGSLRLLRGGQEACYSIDGDRLAPGSALDVRVAHGIWVPGTFDWTRNIDDLPRFLFRLRGRDDPTPLAVNLYEGCSVRRPGDASRGALTCDQARALEIAIRRMEKDAEREHWAVGGYRIHSKLGEGGLGFVFKAKHHGMNRVVALKILRRKWLTDEEFRKRFLVEARLVGRLSHPNLIKVFEVGRHEWKYYFSMEYVDGETVEDLIERDGPLDFPRAVKITQEMVGVIRYLWENGLVHCDIKPSNIMLDRDGRAKLGDFGFVKCNLRIHAAEEGAVLGTPDYMSPEQATGQPLDFRSDVYSLGASLYHMVTGRPPYEGSVTEVMRKHVEGNLPAIHLHRPDTPDPLRLVIDRMMAAPRRRYTNLDRLGEDLARLRENLDGRGRQEMSLREWAARLARENETLRRRLRVATAFLVVAVVILLVTGIAWIIRG